MVPRNQIFKNDRIFIAIIIICCLFIHAYLQSTYWKKNCFCNLFVPLYYHIEIFWEKQTIHEKTTKKETYRNASRLIKIKVVSTSLHTKAMTSYIFLSHPPRQTIESLLLLFILLFYLSSVLAFHIDMR